MSNKNYALAEMLQDLRRGNSAWEVEHLATMPNAATPWGLYRQLLREVDTRRSAIRDHAIAAEGHRRSAFWAEITLQPLKARGLRLAAREAADQAREAAEVLARLEACLRAARHLLPAHLTPGVVAQLEETDGLYRLASAVRAAAELEQPVPREIQSAVGCLPADQAAVVAKLAGEQGAEAEAWKLGWLAMYRQSAQVAPAPLRQALEAAW
jgi:hypothetical protein